MTDRLDTIRKRLASGSPFTPHAGDLAWAVGEIERLTTENAAMRSAAVLNANEYAFAAHEIERLKGENERLAKERDALVGASVVCPMGHGEAVDAIVDAELRAFNASAEIARLDALSRATADDPEDVVPCVPCGKVECACGDASDEEMNA